MESPPSPRVAVDKRQAPAPRDCSEVEDSHWMVMPGKDSEAVGGSQATGIGLTPQVA